MKALVLLFAALLPFAAQADFVPGRVRVGAEASLKIISADGKYGPVKDAKLGALVADGHPGYVGFVLVLNGQPQKFHVVASDGGPCGVTHAALPEGARRGPGVTKLSLVDYSGAKCERAIPNVWEVVLTSRENAEGNASHLVLGGNPKVFFLSL